MHGLGTAQGLARIMCNQALNPVQHHKLFVGPTLSHVQCRDPTLGHDVLEGKV